MSALVERLIAARDGLRPLRMQGEEYIRNPAVEATEAMADACNAIDSQAKEIRALRNCLFELHAMVVGECNSLLDEDSGGSADLSIRIDNLRALSTSGRAG